LQTKLSTSQENSKRKDDLIDQCKKESSRSRRKHLHKRLDKTFKLSGKSSYISHRTSRI
jgi:hypothetical protein